MRTKWYGQYTDANGKTHRVPLATNKTAALQMLGDIVRKIEMGKAGITNPFEDHGKRTLLPTWTTGKPSLPARTTPANTLP